MKEGSFVNLMKVSRMKGYHEMTIAAFVQVGVSMGIGTRHNI